jgi:peptide-methionine (S)-S-oxide reductase
MSLQNLNGRARLAGTALAGLLVLAAGVSYFALRGSPAREPAASENRLAASTASPPDKKGKMTDHRTETAGLAGGCFWCLEAVFGELQGVERVVSGYAGGKVASPTYEQVCSGTTGHAECVRVTFDPTVLSYRDLLLIFFAFHDPTTLNRQGADAGTQYRSAIFWQGPDQKATAEQVIAELTRQGAFDAPIVTEVAPLGDFYPAEDYHQGYYGRNSGQPYCRMVISPKLAKLRKMYTERLKETR